MSTFVMSVESDYRNVIRVWGALVVTCIFCIGCSSGNSGAVQSQNNRWALAVEPIIQTNHEQIWKLTVSSDRPTWYAFHHTDRTGSGATASEVSLLGESGSYTATVWLVFSKVNVASEAESYLKTMISTGAGGGSITRKVEGNWNLQDLIAENILGEPHELAFDQPVMVSEFYDEQIRMMVGDNARNWVVEQSALPNGGETTSENL